MAGCLQTTQFINLFVDLVVFGWTAWGRTRRSSGTRERGEGGRSGKERDGGEGAGGWGADEGGGGDGEAAAVGDAPEEVAADPGRQGYVKDDCGRRVRGHISLHRDVAPKIEIDRMG